ncbi:terminase small subunit [Synechococcus phage S-N03]|uniref:Terminase small subunit n=1 Tax=Synechococcus phage S-N03 TaxID=2718943 RepID=A0A6G8R637_9CAUD|nr:terminase small subunit [Synechococcus phage S-N03]QIN96865.1 terminase small subunit [Synechococcus phage S-N03]
MTTPFESLDETFNVSPVEGEIVPVEDTELVTGTKSEDREDDYQFARQQLHSIVEKMQMTLDGALEVAQESDHPRAFEVAFAGAKHLADVVDKLQDLHAKEKKISEEQSAPSGGGVNNGTVNNVYMTGTTADMLKMLKEAQQEDK